MALWGGRFGEGMSDVTKWFTDDTSDRRLLVVDIQGSIAHVEMLGQAGIISDEETEALVDGLRRILEEADRFEFQDTDEDVHTAVERRLGELVGEVAGKLHTGRSRNDQIALDLRLYLRQATDELISQIRQLVEVLIESAAAHRDVVVPTYTHLQQAQVTTLGHHLLAYAWMLTRDAERLVANREQIDRSPLGAGASAGSTLPLDRVDVAERLAMDGLVVNSLDAVGSRDFAAAHVFNCAQGMAHLSRLAEEVILWASREFRWVTLSDQVSTGSSALPQKRNPDIAELVRGRAASVIGDTAAVLSLQKGLPLAYNRDLQEDKRLVFHADDTLAASLEAMAEMVGQLEFHVPEPGAETTALDLAEALVSRGVPFREAHEVVGRLVLYLEAADRDFGSATSDDLTAVDTRFEDSDVDLLDPSQSAARRATVGAGSPTSVDDQIESLRQIWEGEALN